MVKSVSLTMYALVWCSTPISIALCRNLSTGPVAL